VTVDRCSPEELRTLFLFEKLTDAQLNWLCERGRVEVVPAGPVYAEGDPAASFYVLLDGTVVLSRRIGDDDIDVGAASQPGVYAGAWRAYLGDQVPQTYNQSMRVTRRSRFFVLDADAFAQLMRDWFPMAVHLLDGGFLYRKNVQELTGQRERLLALGTFSAGLTRELNTPAAAAVRATASLRDRIPAMRRGLGAMAGYAWDTTTLETLIRLQDEAAERVPKAPRLSPLEASELEDAVADWLDGHGISDGRPSAPIFVAAGLDVAWLEHVAVTVDAATLEAALKWLNCTVETELLMNEIDDATIRISALVSAAKQYSQLDRAPFQIVDVHELLDSTLLMLSGTFAPGIRVVKDYDLSLPAIAAYPAELNQAWTNLIDNALSAMGDEGVLTVRTGRDRDQVVVEICDTGPGVARQIRPRIFEPFFTTKPAGQGTGLGLDITWRTVVNKHHGEITVESVPGDTRFRVRLPVTPADTDAEGGSMPIDRQWFVDTLRHLGYAQAADEAAGTLPEQMSREDAERFADRFGISRDEVMSRMGGSP
jgi:signal transduction histidine kinase